MSSAYTAKTGRSREEFLQMMEQETWITAEKALELKMIDKIMEPQKQAVQMAAGAVPLLSDAQKETARGMLEARKREERQRVTKAEARLKLLNLKKARRRMQHEV